MIRGGVQGAATAMEVVSSNAVYRCLCRLVGVEGMQVASVVASVREDLPRALLLYNGRMYCVSVSVSGKAV